MSTSRASFFRNSRFRTDAAVSNTGALIQQAQENQLLIIEQSDFDGGPSHQRGVQADYSDLIVRNSRFTRFGNAGVEFDNSSANADLEVVDSYLEETSGWNPDDHVDGIQVGAGRNVTIRNNTVLVPSFGDDRKDTSYVSNSALGIWAELGDVTGTVTIQHNVLGGGGRVIYLAAKAAVQLRRGGVGDRQRHRHAVQRARWDMGRALRHWTAGEPSVERKRF